jgi:hypothetical protein
MHQQRRKNGGVRGVVKNWNKNIPDLSCKSGNFNSCRQISDYTIFIESGSLSSLELL